MLKILLDMDGVLCRWEKGVCDLFGLDYAQVMHDWTPGEFDIEHVIGVSEDDVWKAIDSAGEQWWANLEEYPWSRRLYGDCTKYGDTYFVTSPSQHPSSLSGKLLWMQRFTGDPKFRNYMVGPKKYLCARHDQVLVDDSDKNINEFRRRGGFGILFPRPSNSNHSIHQIYQDPDTVGGPEDYALKIISDINFVLREFMEATDGE